MNVWLLLAAAIVAETIATSALKASDGFSKMAPSAVVVIGYALSFFLLGVVLKRLEVGIVYAIWCGVGMAIVALIGVLVFGESLSPLKVAGLVSVIAGVIMLSIAGGGHQS